MKISVKVCEQLQLNSGAKLNLWRPVAVYVNKFSNENMTDKAGENYLGSAIVCNSPEGLCFSMEVNTQKAAGQKLIEAMQIAKLGCSSFFVISEPGMNGALGSKKKVIFEDLLQVLGDSSQTSIEPMIIVLTANHPNPGSEVTILTP